MEERAHVGEVLFMVLVHVGKKVSRFFFYIHQIYNDIFSFGLSISSGMGQLDFKCIHGTINMTN